MFDAGVLISLLLTLFIWTYLFDTKSKLFVFVEYTYIGIMAANVVVYAKRTLLSKVIEPLALNQYAVIVPLLIGILAYARYSGDTFWLSRYPMALLVGVGTGISLRTVVQTQCLAQVLACTKLDLTSPLTTLNSVLMPVMVIISLIYFIMTREHRGAFGQAASIGRYIIVVAMGTAFGNLAMTRLSLMIARAQAVVEAIFILIGA